VAIFFLFRQKQLTTLPPGSIHQRNNTRKVHVYSLARTDRTGAAVHDRLLAHALVYHWNRVAEKLWWDNKTSFVYNGACLRHMPLPPRLSTERLLRHFGWDTAVPYRCPSKGQSAVYIPDTVYKCVGERELLTPDWREHFRDETRLTDQPWQNLESGNVFHIAVHIRRGDVDLCKYWRRYLPNSHYLRLIQESIPANQTTRVTIFSETRSFESFEDFRALNYTLKLDTGLETVWRALLTADVAILSRSTFSLAPSFLNPNTVVYTPFWNEGLSHWKTVNETAMKVTDLQVKEMWLQSCPQKSTRSIKRLLQLNGHRGLREESGNFVIPNRKRTWWNKLGANIAESLAPAKMVGAVHTPLVFRTLLAEKMRTCLDRHIPFDPVA
jgi:hypothetical protein